tara:strand:- start:1215 stop:1679 length:465 start_codon:yes stop_codon:yes gene_type:complete
MKALFSPEQNAIIAYGIGYENVVDINIVDIPDDYSEERYNYIVNVDATFNPNGFVLKPNQVDFNKRAANVQAMNSYMSTVVNQNSFDVFLSDTNTNVGGYLNGGSRLITWIETVNRNGYNATNVGFKTKTAYRGALVNGVYERAEMILTILNDF